MKKILIFLILIFGLMPQISDAVSLFPGIENQKPITENGRLCLPEGKAVWINQGYQCCDGLVPHLTPGNLGHTSCQPRAVALMENIFISPLTNPIVAVVIILFILVTIVILIRKKRKRA